MASIIIGTSGGANYPTFNAAAYAALATGSLNTVTVESGRYTPPSSDWQWWGLTQGNGMDKPCTFVVSGSTEAFFDGRIYLDDSVATYYGSGIWRMVVASTALGGGAISSTAVKELYFGAVPGTSLATTAMGSSYLNASTLGNIDPVNGVTIAGMVAGYGLWFWQRENSNTEAVIYVYTGSAVVKPCAYWGGLAVMVYKTTGTLAGTWYSPFVFERSGTADPSGSTVGAGFAMIGAIFQNIGSTTAGTPGTSRPWSNIRWTGIKMYGAEKGLFMSCNSVGTTMTGCTLDGSWYYNDLRLPTTFPSRGAQSNYEGLTIKDRVFTFSISGGTCIVGNSHDALNLGNNTETIDAEINSANNKCVGTRFICPTGANDSRSMSIKAQINPIVQDCEFTGFNTYAEIGGQGTRVYGNWWHDNSYCSISAAQGAVPVQFYNAAYPSGVQPSNIRFARNIIDTTTDSASAAADRYAAVSIQTYANSPWPSGVLTMVNNVFLVQSGKAAVMMRQQPPGAIPGDSGYLYRNQNMIGNYHNSDYSGTGKPCIWRDGDVAASVASTFAELCVGGDTTSQANVKDVTANIWSRGDRPRDRFGAIAIAR